MRLLIRGGSIAAAHGVKQGYVDILRENKALEGLEIINRSRFGETSFDAVRTFYDDIAPFEPRLLILHFGIDDAFAGVYRSEFQENLVQIVRLARRLFNPSVFLATSQTFDNPHVMEAVNIFYRSLRIVATDLNCLLIPVHTYWVGYLSEHGLPSHALTLNDPRHPNEKGHAVMAEVIGRWIEFFLKR